MNTALFSQRGAAAAVISTVQLAEVTGTPPTLH